MRIRANHLVPRAEISWMNVCEYGAGSERNDNCKLNMFAGPDL